MSSICVLRFTWPRKNRFIENEPAKSVFRLSLKELLNDAIDFERLLSALLVKIEISQKLIRPSIDHLNRI